MKAPGIRLRTTVAVVLAVAVVWLAAAWLTWRNAEAEASEVFDGHLAQAASMLIAQSAMEIEDQEDFDRDYHAPLTHRYARKVAFQVWDRGRVLLIHSQNAPNDHLGPIVEGFSDNRVGGAAWRVFTAWNARGDLLVHVGERVEAREAMAAELAEGLLVPLLWALPTLAILLWLVIGRAVRPLAVLAGEIADRAPDRLEPLAGIPVPREVEPLVRRLNALLARVGEALHAEKRFTGDAAHELRTPIAALTAQAEVALGAADDRERRRALEAVLQAARRMARLVEQLLTLARADSALPAAWPSVDLAAIVRGVAGELAPGAIERDVEVEVDAPEHVEVRGEAGWLGILVRNLVDNALRHAPPGTAVAIALREDDDAILLEVADRGPGVPAADLPRLGERFRRGEGALGGSGLGLSIVRRIAELHATAPEFGPGEGGSGLRVRIRFSAGRR